MNRKRLAGIIAAAVVVVVLIVLFAVVIPALTLPLPPEVTPQPEMVTLDCTDLTPTSLQARGEVEDTSIGPLWLRGFVYTEGTGGASTPAVIPLHNPSFALGNPPSDWDAVGDITTFERSREQVRVGDHSARVTRGADGGFVRQSLPAADFRGKQVTLGAWVYVVDGAAVVWLHDSDSATTTTISTTGQWVWATVTRTFDSAAVWTQVRLAPHSNGTAYFDGIVLVEGRAVFEHGQFSEGAYSLTIDNLEPDTSYTIRAFGQNDGGVGYGDVVTCRTPAGP